jgi:RNA polymerase sigma-70 factor, ECF subfamily
VEDAQLVEGALAGKAECYDVLYARYRPRVWRSLVGLGIPKKDADGLTQEVLSSVCRKLNVYDAKRSMFSTWVYGYSKKAAAAYWRARARHPDPDSLDDTPEELIASDLDGPERVYERNQVRQGVRDLVCRLPAKVREPVVLYWFKELTVAEIARFLKRPDSTVRSQLNEGMRELRGLIASEPELSAR